MKSLILILLVVLSLSVRGQIQKSIGLNNFIDTTAPKEYYYMWNYSEETDDGWGENTIILKFKPSKKEIKKIAFDSIKKMMGNEFHFKYAYFTIVEFEEKTDNKNILQNRDALEKAKLNYQISTYKKP